MAQLSHLLLFDPDPDGLDTLTYGFEREGALVTGTSDFAEARLLLQEGIASVKKGPSQGPSEDPATDGTFGPSPPSPPRLLVVNLGESEKPAIELLRFTTTNPRTRNVPCVAIGRDVHRSVALAAGAFVFLSVPLFLRDIIGVCRMVAAASLPGSRPSTDAEVSLSLSEVGGVYFLVRALAITGRSALVAVRRGPSRGELRFIQGALASADVGSVQGLSALHRMLLWEDATLQFKFKNVVRRGSQLSMKSHEILEECDRFLRDFSHEARDLGFANTVYTAALDRMQPSAALPVEVVPVLKLFDGQRDLAQLLEESPFRIFDTLKIVKRFVADGAIETKAPLPLPVATAVGGISGPGALDSWLQKKAPAFGPEVGGTRSASNAAPQLSVSEGAAGPARTGPGGDGPVVRIASPFVVTGGAGTTGTTTGANMNKGVAGNPRKKPIPKKSVNQPPNVQENAITPPPVIRLNEAPTKPNAAVARGEFKISAPTPRKHEIVPPAGALSVMIEPSVVVLPAPVPMTSTAPPPVTVQAAPPSVIIGPMSVILDPSIATPQGTAAVVPPPPRKSDPHVRSGSDNFNALESDFFEREADLYKRDSVESFDDLDGANGRSRKA